MGIIFNTLESTMKFRNRQVMKKLGIGGYSGQNHYYRLFGNKIKKPLPFVLFSKMMAVAELAVLVPANLGVKGTKKVSNQIHKNKPNVSEKTKKRFLGGLINAGIVAGKMYVKKATGYSDAKRGAKLALLGAKAGRKVSYFTKPLIGSGISLLGNLTKNIARSFKQDAQKTQMNANGNYTPNDENYLPSRSTYKKKKKQNPDLTADEILQNQTNSDSEADSKDTEMQEPNTKENEMQESETAEDEIHQSNRADRANIEQDTENSANEASKSNNKESDVIQEENQKEPELTHEELVELEKSKMINPNIYIEHLDVKSIDLVLEDFDSIYSGKNKQSKKALSILEKIKNR